MIILEDLPYDKRLEYLESMRKEAQEREKAKEMEIFGNFARYRCEQVNVTKIDDIPKSNSTIKTQFSLNIDSDRMLAKVKLEDYIYEIVPNLLNTIFDFIKLTEFIKHNIYIQLGNNGKIEKIINKEEINKNWKDFLNSEKFETEFVKKLRNKNPDVLYQIIEAGNKQFALNTNTEEDYKRELFYLLIFDEYLTSKEMDVIRKEDFMFRSVLIPDTIIPMTIESEMIKDDANQTLKYRKKGIAIISNEKRNEIIGKYDKYQKPDIHFSYTEYYLNFSIETEIDNHTRLPVKAQLDIYEGVKHNIESICNFNLRKLN
jgi:nucleoside-triphosphatase THEP1